MATAAYSPYPPAVIGDAWVPIVEEPYQMSLNREQGYWFNLSSSATVVTARVYVGEPSNTWDTLDVPAVNIYPAGGESSGGPIRQVLIPATFAAGSTGTSFPTPINASSIVQGLYSPGDNSGVAIVGTPPYGLNINFGVTYFAAQLANKRILNVELLYITLINSTAEAYIASSADTMYVGALTANTVPTAISGSSTIPAKSLGNYTPFYGTRTTYTTGVGDSYPWNYASLARLDPSTTAAQRVAVQITGDSPLLYYAALRVTYCDETRTAVAGRRSDILSPQFGWGPVGTAFSLPVLDITLSGAPLLTAGDYVITTEYGHLADFEYNLSDPVKIRALRQLYPLPRPGIHGVTIPTTLTVGDARRSEATDHIPAISLHTSSAVVADSHGYNQQIQAPVYLNINATQNIINAAPAAATSYPLARFYARRFGDTNSPLGLRDAASPTTYAEISVAEFDALPEITDGWKQVDLTFTGSMPTFGTSGVSTWEWVSRTSSPNQWQVLGARASSVTGLAFAEIGPAQWLVPTTYGGATAEATWDQGSGAATLDRQGDLTLMFAMMPPVTGLTLTQSTMSVTGLTECGVMPQCIPTGVTYNQLTWNASSLSVVADAFNRTTSSGWGTADTGVAWTVGAGTAADFSTNGSVAQISEGTPNVLHTIINGTTGADVDIQVDIAASQLAATSSHNAYILARYADSSNMYRGILQMVPGSSAGGTINIGIDKIVAGVTTSLITGGVTNVLWDAGEYITVRFQLQGTTLRIKAWLTGTAEPEEWGATATDSSLTAAGRVGVGAILGASYSGSLPVVFSFENLTAVPFGFGGYELQRMDQWSAWETIMLATNPALQTFNDFEARIGVESSYRIRACHELDFCGEWSSVVSATIAAPGVTGSMCESSVLVFTSNSRQDGSDTLAHIAIWDGTPAEQFAFIEASSVRMQQMYNRDYQVAFHGTERGGEQFERVLLMNNAAVSIANFEQGFQALRDLAWDSIPYVAVRDEHGSRWLATVIVPNGTYQPPQHSLQFASITVVEVTATPYPVNP